MRHVAPALIGMMLVRAGIVFAGGPFDGEWKGSTDRVKSRGCDTWTLIATITEGRVIIIGTSGNDGFRAEGTVAADGTFTGDSNVTPWRGAFTAYSATGTTQLQQSCGRVSFSLVKVK